MTSDPRKYLEQPCQSVDDVVEFLSSFERYCLKNNDLRGVFCSAYLQITQAIQHHLKTDQFRDNSWVERYLVRFGNLYREALFNETIDNQNLVPKSWRISFNLAKECDGFIIQHLLLGINAHINHDLAIALYEVGIDPQRNNKYADHTTINKILEKATNSLKQAIAEKYAPVFKRLDMATGYISNDIAAFSIPKAREHAWAFAVALTSARNEVENQILKKSLNEQAAVLSRLIMASPARSARLKSGIRKIKWIDGLITRIKSWLGSY